MLKLVDKKSPYARKLVLGFDAGCFTCSDLARRIEEKIGEKVEVRSLHDPQVEEWRRRALGEDIPWAPTLIEVKGAKVQAWTGLQLGIHLSRFLGPVATWRVMQTLGEVGAVPKADGSAAIRVDAGLSRVQFLKGMGGAALALSMLSSNALFPSKAEALPAPSFTSPGTLSQRIKAKGIVRNSSQFQKLEQQQENYLNNTAAGLDFNDKYFWFSNDGYYAIVGATSDYNKRGVMAVFGVDMFYGKTQRNTHVVGQPVDSATARLRFYTDGVLKAEKNVARDGHQAASTDDQATSLSKRYRRDNNTRDRDARIYYDYGYSTPEACYEDTVPYYRGICEQQLVPAACFVGSARLGIFASLGSTICNYYFNSYAGTCGSFARMEAYSDCYS